MIGRVGFGLPELRLEERVMDYLSSVRNRVVTGYGLPLLSLQERVTNYLYSDWKSGLRRTGPSL